MLLWQGTALLHTSLACRRKTVVLCRPSCSVWRDCMRFSEAAILQKSAVSAVAMLCALSC